MLTRDSPDDPRKALPYMDKLPTANVWESDVTDWEQTAAHCLVSSQRKPVVTENTERSPSYHFFLGHQVINYIIVGLIND